MKVKVDYNNLLDLTMEIVCKSKSQQAKENGFGIGFGFELFNKYLEKLSKRAIEVDDPIILECLINTKILTCSKEDEEDIIKRVKEVEREKEYGTNINNERK